MYKFIDIQNEQNKRWVVYFGKDMKTDEETKLRIKPQTLHTQTSHYLPG